MLSASIAPRTQRVYFNALNVFKNFRLEHDIQEVWPVPLSHIEYFIAYLHQKGYSWKSASTFISAISFMHKMQNMQNCSLHFRCRKLLEGYRRTKPSKDSRMPILLDSLVKIFGKLESICISNYETALFRASFTLAFFGLFRVGELVWTSSNEPDRQLKLSDIHFISDSGKTRAIHIHLRKSKANQAGPVEIVKIYPIQSVVCPVKAMMVYLSVKPKGTDHLLCHADGRPLTRFQFSAVLSRTLHSLSLQADRYKSHSFRIGAATWLAQKGTPYETIRKLGRWSSNAFLNYIRC